ncbi:MAG TPA: hypothetical protein PKC24_06690 [Cyclobacteriaceae bacterium]|nr:hypothetical protein [Cyclobacteriaceae bacterium]
MKKLFLLLSVSLIVQELVAQTQLVPPVIRATNFAERLNYNFSPMQTSVLGMPMRSAELVGDSYLYPDWRPAVIMMYDDDKTLNNYLVRYDLNSDEFEFNFGKEIRVLKGNRVKSFALVDSISMYTTYFMNGKDFVNKNDVPFDGFLQVLSDGTLPLLKRYEVFIRQPDFNMALNVGSIDYKVIKKEHRYYMKEGKLHNLPKGKSAILNLMSDEKESVNKFVKVNQLKFTEDHHLALLFDHYNNLKKK